ncbi:hypothetical protein QJS10_CPB15g00229 [Acorus calamus]|uniref:Cancer-related nucleoside-triphosphatase homolog n=1 Tax=Acorus calamus TaxID=4465 RepID=A0AAV9D2X6_ACOCL|nr:hypothetical protein QJS10_CPB15g00229 [Acorus calamus]
MASAPGKCFLVTGPPGVGKTTLVMRVLEKLRNSNPCLNVWGFYTCEVRQDSERVGFEVVTVDGRHGPLASCLTSSAESLRWPSVGKYKVVACNFEYILIPIQVKDDIDLFIIDEVGKMELFCSTFYPAVLEIIGLNVPILASIPIPKFGHDIPAVARLRNHPGVTVSTLSKSNRDAIKEEIYSRLVGLLQKE